MKHAERREVKLAITLKIQDIFSRVEAQSKVPDRVLSGDYLCVIAWKDCRDEIVKASQKQFEKLSLNKLREEFTRLEELLKGVF